MSRAVTADNLGSIALFCQVARLGSFTAAAVQAGLTQPAVSRAIARLEVRLGVRLFVRSTRQIRLTDAGAQYYRQCSEVLRLLDAAERDLAGAQHTPSGHVRLSAPTPLGQLWLLPLLPAFRARYPDITLEVQLSNHNVDLIADHFDLAIRGRTPPDSRLVARPLRQAELVVCAAPAYLQARGVPAHPDALAGHDCIQFRLPSSGQPVPWRFRLQGVEINRQTGGGLTISDDLLGCVTLARHGGGLLQTYRFMVADALARGELQEVLSDYGGCSRPFSLLYPASQALPPRVRVLVDYLLAQPAPGS